MWCLREGARARLRSRAHGRRGLGSHGDAGAAARRGRARGDRAGARAPSRADRAGAPGAGRRRPAAHAGRPPRRAGGGDGAVRRGAARGGRRSRRVVRRAVHDRSRVAGCRGRRGRGRARRRASALELSRVDEPPGVTPRRRAGAAQLARRRIVALILVLGVVGGGIWAATAAIGGGSSKEPPPTTTAAAPPPPKTFRIVFPEGFTRAEMAQRVTAVDGIARRKRGIVPALNAAAYLRLTASSTLPGDFAGDHEKRSLEGFLFPSTYELFEHDPTRRLVE